MEATKSVEPTVQTKPSRLMSLDVFRGATIAAMMMVNNPGDWGTTFAPLKHASWHGWTFTDLVFPFFVWIVGVAIPLSIARRLQEGADRGELFKHAVRRALIIFALGFFLNSFGYLFDFKGGFGAWIHDYLASVRIPGVLQRIAVCYLAAVAIYLCAGWRAQVAWIVGLLAGYWALMMLVPVPGYGPGVLEKVGNFSQYIDNLLLNGPVIGKHVYQASGTWDPEGVVSTLPAIASCLFGVLAGNLLRAKLSPEAKVAWIYTGGVVLLLCGQIMSIWLPINKPIWTSSYAVFMAGMAMVCFGFCYWIVDVQQKTTWAKPFAIYGMNAITVFVLSGMVGRIMGEIRVGESSLKGWLYTHSFGMAPNPQFGSLLWALAYVTLLYLVAWYMHHRKWFVRF